MMTPRSDHAALVFSSLASAGAVPERIAASWRRCVLDHGLDPAAEMPPQVLTGLELRCARSELGRLLAVADAALDRLHALVSPLGYAVLMTDAQGTVVARRVAGRDEPSCRHWRLWTGAVWSETLEGTNGVGTCLAEGRPVTVHRGEHFRDRHARLTCTAAPLFDAGGRIAGALDISSSRQDVSGAILPLAMASVVEAARRIEAACFHDAFRRATLLALPPAADGGVGCDASAAVVAVDGERRIVGATRAARDMLALDDGRIASGTVLADPHDTVDGFADAQRAVMAGALSRTQGNVTEAAHLLGISRATLHRKMRALGVGRRAA